MTNFIKAEQAIQATFAKADQMYGTNLQAICKVTWKLRGRHTAGKASVRYNGGITFRNDGSPAQRQIGEMTLHMNTQAVEKYIDEVVNDIIPHEIAHLVCFARPELGKGHDAGWKQVCRALGGSASRTHSLDLEPARKTSTFTYITDDGTKVELGAKRHQKVQSGLMIYRMKGSATNSGRSQKIAARHFTGNDNVKSFTRTGTPKKQTRRPAAAAAKKGSAGAKQSKKQAATAIFIRMSGSARKDVIAAFVAEAGLSAAGAATYYQQIKKEQGL